MATARALCTLLGDALGKMSRRTLCTVQLTPPQAPKWETRQKNFFELATTLPRNGAGYRFARRIWLKDGRCDSFWTVVGLKLKPDGLHGKAYGRLTWRGRQDPRIREIRSPRKRGWRYLRSSEA
mmetsp:Transcript_4234/g.10937  ORF Transcript_4234/g.10937 Transcript_4234/m.10937 type:complete len:124 (-) Transcript_4234:316-687(-)